MFKGVVHGTVVQQMSDAMVDRSLDGVVVMVG